MVWALRCLSRHRFSHTGSSESPAKAIDGSKEEGFSSSSSNNFFL